MAMWSSFESASEASDEAVAQQILGEDCLSMIAMKKHQIMTRTSLMAQPLATTTAARAAMRALRSAANVVFEASDYGRIAVYECTDKIFFEARMFYGDGGWRLARSAYWRATALAQGRPLGLMSSRLTSWSEHGGGVKFKPSFERRKVARHLFRLEYPIFVHFEAEERPTRPDEQSEPKVCF